MNASRRTSAAAAARGWRASPDSVAAMLAALALLLGLLIAGPAARAADPTVEEFPNVPSVEKRRGMVLFPSPNAVNDCGGAAADERALVLDGNAPGGPRRLLVVDVTNPTAAPLTTVDLPQNAGSVGGMGVDQCGTTAYVNFRNNAGFEVKIFKVDLTATPPAVGATPILEGGISGTGVALSDQGTDMALSPDGSLLVSGTVLVRTADGKVLSTGIPPLSNANFPSSGPRSATDYLWSADSETLYGTDGNGQDPANGGFFSVDLSDPVNPKTTSHRLPEGLQSQVGIALSPDQKKLYVSARDPRPGLETPAKPTPAYVFVYDTSDLSKVVQTIAFDDPATFDVFNLSNTFGQFNTLGLEVAGDKLFVLGDSYLAGYDLAAGKWLGLAKYSDSTSGRYLDVDAKGTFALIAPTLLKVPSALFQPTQLPQSELAIAGDTEPRIDIALGGDLAFVLRAGAADVYTLPALQANPNGVKPDFDATVVKGDPTSLQAGDYRAWVKTQEGAKGHLYSYYVYDQLFNSVPGWVEATGVPADLFPDTATGPNDLAAQAGTKAGDKVFAIARTGVAVFSNTGALDSDNTTIKPEIAYTKTIDVKMPLTGLAISSDGKTLFGAGPKGVVSIDVASEKVTEKDVSGAGLTPTGAVAVSEDGKTLFAGTKDAAGRGAVTEMDAATLEPGTSRRDDKMSDSFDPVAMALGPDDLTPAKRTQLWTLGGGAEQFGVLYTVRPALWSIGDLKPTPAKCHAVVSARAVDALAACDGGLYVLRGRGRSITQPTSPDPDTPGQPKPPASAAPAVPVPSATPTPTPTTPSAVSKTTKVTVKAKKKDKLKVKVSESPKLGAQNQWKFSIAKKKGKKFAAIKRGGKVKVWRTNGRKHIKVVNLPKGKYRVVLKPQRGYEGSKSKAVKLKR